MLLKKAYLFRHCVWITTSQKIRMEDWRKLCAHNFLFWQGIVHNAHTMLKHCLQGQKTKNSETSLLDFLPAASTGVKMVSQKTTHLKNKLSQTSPLSLSVSHICLCLSHVLVSVTHFFQLSNSVLSTGITVKASWIGQSYPYMTHRWENVW